MRLEFIRPINKKLLADGKETKFKNSGYAVEILLNAPLLKIKDLLRFVFTKNARKLLIFRQLRNY